MRINQEYWGQTTASFSMESTSLSPDDTPDHRPLKLLDQLRECIRVKHYSIRTEAQYMQWLRRFILFHGKRQPPELGAAEVEALLSH